MVNPKWRPSHKKVFEETYISNVIKNLLNHKFKHELKNVAVANDKIWFLEEAAQEISEKHVMDLGTVNSVMEAVFLLKISIEIVNELSEPMEQISEQNEELMEDVAQKINELWEEMK